MLLTPEQKKLFDLLGLTCWRPKYAVPAEPLAEIEGSAVTADSAPLLAPSVSDVPYDTVVLLKDVAHAKVVWILAEEAVFQGLASAPKAFLRALMQCTRYRVSDIAPVLVKASGNLCGQSAAEALDEQLSALSPEVMISHLPIPGAVVLPPATTLQNEAAARQSAYHSLYEAGLCE